MHPFDPGLVVATLTLPALLLALGVGAAMGLAMVRAGHRPFLLHIFWLLACGAAFFVPMAVLRGFEGLEFWSRLVGSMILWFVFAGSMWITVTITWRRR